MILIFCPAFPGPGVPHSLARPTSPLTHFYTPSAKQEENYTANNDDTLGRFRRVVVKHYRELDNKSDTAYTIWLAVCVGIRRSNVSCPPFYPFPTTQQILIYNPVLSLVTKLIFTILGDLVKPACAYCKASPPFTRPFQVPSCSFPTAQTCLHISIYSHAAQAKRTDLIAKPSHLYTRYSTGEKS
jgi:hypothetical protein